MSDDHIKRCDVRVPIDLYNEIEKIAVEEYNAPVYHKTGKPQVSSTIIQLLRLGIENLREEVSDTIPDKIRELESRIEQIQSTSISDTNLDEKINHAIANLKNDKEFIGDLALEVQKITSEDASEQAEIVEDEEILPRK